MDGVARGVNFLTHWLLNYFEVLYFCLRQNPKISQKKLKDCSRLYFLAILTFKGKLTTSGFCLQQNSLKYFEVIQ